MGSGGDGALELVGMVFDVYGSAEVRDLKELLIEKGAKPRVGAEGVGNAC